MNNLAARLFFVFIGILLILSFIFNKWINKELAQTVKPKCVVSCKQPVTTLLPAKAAVVEYDVNSDYPTPAPAGQEETPVVVKKTERVLDKKIIYEMPTSNKFLLQ